MAGIDTGVLLVCGRWTAFISELTFGIYCLLCEQLFPIEGMNFFALLGLQGVIAFIMGTFTANIVLSNASTCLVDFQKLLTAKFLLQLLQLLHLLIILQHLLSLRVD